jgi:hypothetical protein
MGELVGPRPREASSAAREVESVGARARGLRAVCSALRSASRPVYQRSSGAEAE